MQKRTTEQAIKNFLKVGFKAFTRPTRILTLGLSVATAVVLPQVAIPVLVAGGLAITGMSWADINDPDFISKALLPQNDNSVSGPKQIELLIRKLEQKLQQKDMFPEVSTDLNETVETLRKISQIIQILPKDEQGSIAFVVDQIDKLITRLMQLLDKEQLARRFLTNEDKNDIETELTALQSSIDNISDKVAKNQLQKVIKQKIEQINTHNQVEHRLTRIDAYIANIRAALFTTYSNLTKLQLKDETSLVDEADLLTESMKQIVDEIDAFEEMGIDITLDTQDEPRKSKSKTKEQI